jgi:hypothetical protein
MKMAPKLCECDKVRDCTGKPREHAPEECAAVPDLCCITDNAALPRDEISPQLVWEASLVILCNSFRVHRMRANEVDAEAKKAWMAVQALRKQIDEHLVAEVGSDAQPNADAH